MDLSSEKFKNLGLLNRTVVHVPLDGLRLDVWVKTACILMYVYVVDNVAARAPLIRHGRCSY